MHDLDRVVLRGRDSQETEMAVPVPIETAETLLAVTSGEELEQFLGGLLRAGARAARRSIPPALRRPLITYLRGAAAGAVPGLDFGSRNRSGAAQAGVRAGRRIATSILSDEAELDGGGPPDEREAARRIVELAGRVANEATKAPSNATPSAAAAVVARARGSRPPDRIAAPGPGIGRARRGTWTMTGRTIVLRT